MQKIVIYLSGLFLGFLIIEVVGLQALLLFLIALWYWTLRRGLLTVRAFMYLGLLTQRMSPMEANDRVFRIGYLAATEFAPAAKSFVRERFDGKQLKMIAEARSFGFVG